MFILSAILWKTLLPSVLFEIVNDSKIGTPAEFKADKVLEKFARQDLVTKSLVIGNFSKVLSLQFINDEVLDCLFMK